MNEPGELERALDALLSQLGAVYAELSNRVARSEVAVAELDANNRRLRVLQRQAEEATRPVDPPQEESGVSEDSTGADKEKEGEEELRVPAVSNIEAVLAQARAIRGDDEPKASARAGSSRAASTAGGPGRRGSAQPGRRGGRSAPAGSSSGRALTRGAISRTGSSSGRSAMEKQAPASSSSSRPRQNPPPPPTTLPPLPALPRLPKRLLLALKRLPSEEQHQQQRHQQGEQHWAAPIVRAASSFQASLASGFEVPSAEEVEAEQWRSSLRGGGGEVGSYHVNDANEKEHRHAWLGVHGARWVRALALAEAQQSLARKMDTLAASPNGPHLSVLRGDIRREWGEVEAEATRLELQVPFSVAVSNSTKWRNRGVRMLLAGGEVSPGTATAAPQSAARPPPAEVWLPPRVLQSSMRLLQQAGAQQAQSSLVGDRMWEELLFPGAASLPRDRRRAELVYSSPQQMVSLAKARHQLQLYLLQIYLEAGPALALLPTHAAPSRLRAGEEAGAEGERYGARIRLAHAFLCCGLDRGLCTISTRAADGNA